MRIITFSCQNNVFVYPDKCGVSPMLPYKSHDSIDSAKEHLRLRGVKKPMVIIEK